MNIGYLDTLPRVENKYNNALDEGERVVFAEKLKAFGTEEDKVLGFGDACDFTLTNRRIIANNGVGVWTIDIAEDIIKFTKVESKKFIFKSVYFVVNLNKEVVFENGSRRLRGFHFYFNNEETDKLEQIITQGF